MTNTKEASSRTAFGVALVGALCGSLASLAQAQSGTAAEVKADDAQGGLEEVVVTAERREQSIQKSSLSISVLNEKALESVNDAKDIATIVPGVQVSQGASTLQAYVRGIGDFSSSALNQSSVSFNIDGIYAADTSTVSPQFYDLARVEVLKGPQGTLYGRNSSAGSINLIYQHPVLGHFASEVVAELGNYSAVHLGGTVNLPLGDTVAFRGAVNYIDRDGYLSDGTNDDSQKAGRVQFLFQPADSLSVRISADGSKRTGNGAGSVFLRRQPGNDAFTGAVNQANNDARLAASPVVFTPGAGLPPAAQAGLLEDAFIDQKQHNVGAEINWDLGFAELSFLPSFRRSESSIGTYSSGSPFLNQEDVDQDSYELRLSRDADWGNIVVGSYYLDLDQTTAAQVYQATFIIALQTADLGTRSLAEFGQATFNLSDSLRLIGGFRFTEEDRTIDANDISNNVRFSSDVTFRKWTWRAGAEYDITPANMAYVTVSTGFKSGGFNIFAPTPAVTNAYQPESLTSYAVGVRNRFLDNRVQWNVEAYYWDLKDAQQNALQFTPAGNLQFSTFNAASATIHGFDTDLVIQPSSSDRVTATVAYLDTKFDQFILNPPFPTDPRGNGCLLNNSAPPFSVDCSGRGLPRAPRWSGSAG
jgi:iron complex outermembrane receptor protein